MARPGPEDSAAISLSPEGDGERGLRAAEHDAAGILRDRAFQEFQAATQDLIAAPEASSVSRLADLRAV
jgi:hypothetical protein